MNRFLIDIYRLKSKYFIHSRQCINRTLASNYVKDEEIQLAKVSTMLIKFPMNVVSSTYTTG
jgi:hypothetical protein